MSVQQVAERKREARLFEVSGASWTDETHQEYAKPRAKWSP